MTSREFIALVVQDFYRKASDDVLIGYHFKRIHDFSTHLPRINAFWEFQLLGQTQIKLDPPLDVLRAHMPLNIHRGEVGRWVMLFSETLKAHEGPEHGAIREKWEEKIAHFQQIFLQSPLLFPQKP